MRGSKFRRPCKVLIFTEARVLWRQFEVKESINYNPNEAYAILTMHNDDSTCSDFTKLPKVIDRLFDAESKPP